MILDKENRVCLVSLPSARRVPLTLLVQYAIALAFFLYFGELRSKSIHERDTEVAKAELLFWWD